ncbi:hypothetical protein NE172_06295 [Clostridium botulinum]|uniref:Uncharacterized protein n=1 Tax=Clostridium botulinum TaxID=1491 RepID=A0A6B4JKR1_CLOBO|nr:hypothetical protein [Clostridium botulinum]EES49706.1 hypothetical protein CLO_2550 [Clostridium botulinum E1 str. 'BoNT E Beluga']MBY6760772.1 hypothetical protein [Clostridium botulinum]MBY6919936.1 hypothetical protein [Clostridium botulinum]MCR1130558.1 hypothetical protein [Clostridium botulinum]NFJ57462.1 hypothetical protein [Clostridium botulinum]
MGFITECFYDTFLKEDKEELNFILVKIIVMLSCELTFQKRDIKSIMNIFSNKKFDINAFEIDNFKRILKIMLDTDGLQEFEERLNNNNIIQNNINKNSEKNNYSNTLKFFIKKHIKVLHLNTN